MKPPHIEYKVEKRLTSPPGYTYIHQANRWCVVKYADGYGGRIVKKYRRHPLAWLFARQEAKDLQQKRNKEVEREIKYYLSRESYSID